VFVDAHYPQQRPAAIGGAVAEQLSRPQVGDLTPGWTYRPARGLRTGQLCADLLQHGLPFDPLTGVGPPAQVDALVDHPQGLGADQIVEAAQPGLSDGQREPHHRRLIVVGLAIDLDDTTSGFIV